MNQIYAVTLQHTIDGKVVATKACEVQCDSEDEAKKIALEIAGSMQGGMFRVMREGRHLLEVVKVEKA